MVTIIPKRVEHIWDIWNIRGAIMFSFLVQVFLVLLAPFRRRSDNLLLQFLIWIAYMLADWAANFTMGLITNNAIDNNNGGSKEILRALWAPFVLVHFGGPDTITAFSIEDNQLWLRQVPGLLFQVGAAAYVFVLTLPRNTLWAPTLLIFVSGFIKCFERTRALYIASSIEKYFCMFCFIILVSPESGDNVFRDAELTLESIYERYYTKASAVWGSKVGRLVRLVALGSMVVALSLFSATQTKSSTATGSVKFDDVDVIITYTLFCGALLLEIIFLLQKLLPSCCDDGGLFSILFCQRSRSIPGCNLIRLCLSQSRPEKFLEAILDQIAYSVGVEELLEHSKYKTKTPFDLGWRRYLWACLVDIFPFNERFNASTLKERISLATQGVEDVVDNVMHHIANPIVNYKDTDDYPFGRTLVLLHIATTLCHADTSDNFSGPSRQYSKLLSDYMMYLHRMQPDILSKVPGIKEDWEQETMVHASIESEILGFFEQNGVTSKDHDEEEASQCVLSNPLNYDDDNSSPPYPTVLFLARSMAQDLQKFQPNRKWEAIAKMWVQMLIFAAAHCDPSIHVRHLPIGGELISIVRVIVSGSSKWTESFLTEWREVLRNQIFS